MGLRPTRRPCPIVCLSLGPRRRHAADSGGTGAARILLAYMAAYSGLGREGALRLAVFATHTAAMIDELLDHLRRLLVKRDAPTAERDAAPSRRWSIDRDGERSVGCHRGVVVPPWFSLRQEVLGRGQMLLHGLDALVDDGRDCPARRNCATCNSASACVLPKISPMMKHLSKSTPCFWFISCWIMPRSCRFTSCRKRTGQNWVVAPSSCPRADSPRLRGIRSPALGRPQADRRADSRQATSFSFCKFGETLLVVFQRASARTLSPRGSLRGLAPAWQSRWRASESVTTHMPTT